MSTLISVHNSDGCVGRCDAHCYNAKEPDCTCICGGKNHGAGLKKAAANTEQMAQNWIDRYNADHPGQKLSFVVSPNQKRLPL